LASGVRQRATTGGVVKPRKPLKRGTPPKRVTPLARRARSRIHVPTLMKDLWHQARIDALLRDDHQCQAFSRGLESPCDGVLEVHHILPRGRGGNHRLSNLVTLCAFHHAHVHANPAESYALGLLARSAA
jgi:5-methylcytosine-specific restriction endonuclease McrA